MLFYTVKQKEHTAGRGFYVLVLLFCLGFAARAEGFAVDNLGLGIDVSAAFPVNYGKTERGFFPLYSINTHAYLSSFIFRIYAAYEWMYGEYEPELYTPVDSEFISGTAEIRSQNVYLGVGVVMPPEGSAKTDVEIYVLMGVQWIFWEEAGSLKSRDITLSTEETDIRESGSKNFGGWVKIGLNRKLFTNSKTGLSYWAGFSLESSGIPLELSESDTDNGIIKLNLTLGDIRL